jgi:uncharacterized protein (DUF1501 family)
MLQPNRKSQSNRMSQQWIFLKKKAIESKGADNKTPESSSIWSLPHPRVPVASRFLFQDGRLFEVQRVMDPDRPRSWFIGDTVQSGSPSMARQCDGTDGSLYAATPVDALFLALPWLDKHRRKVHIRV